MLLSRQIRKELLLVTALVTISSVMEVTATVASSITNSLLSHADQFYDKRESFNRILTTLHDRQQHQQQQLQQHYQHQQGTESLTEGRGGRVLSFLHTGYDYSSSSSSNNNHHHRNLINDDDDSDQDACDSRFVQCLPNKKCTQCFGTLSLEQIDWTGVTADMDCSDVVNFLVQGGHCKSLDTDSNAKDIFCETFNACVIWDDDDDNGNGGGNTKLPDGWVNCTALTDCEWEGMHKAWIGDGVCHDNMVGCYNTPICGYDGGDCCEDTCEITDVSSYVECGHDGYACKDTKSSLCNSDLTTKCPNDNKKNDKKDPNDVKCEEEEAKYRLVMYDSFGDGWDTTTLTIQPEGGNSKDMIVFKGGLVDGFQGTEYICLSKSPQCYNVISEGGTWGVEISWEVRPIGEGSPSIAGGGAPGDCDFSVAGEVCSKTCDGTKPDTDPTKDPEYKSFKDLYSCIEDKCVIQLGACNDDDACTVCFAEDAPDFCYGIDTFVSVIDCTMCSCTEKEGSEFCTKKSGPGQVIPPQPNDDGEGNDIKQCSPKETIAGTSAIMDYSSCTDLDSVSLLISNFDQNNFGQLDSFETCAHSYRDESDHGGRTALSCMQILKNTMDNPTVEDNKNAPKQAISALATNLYNHAGSFCDCSKKASDACPLCPSFFNFKTILYESIDACQSLDAIDCDSWNEFWKPCKANLEKEFQSSELNENDQCEYVKNDCGGAGSFPAFRRLDCEEEISSEAWNFYKQFSKKCLKGSNGIPPGVTPSPNPPVPVPSPTNKPNPAPVPAPTTPATPENKPTPKPYIPSNDSGSGKPYVPSSDTDDDSNKKSKSHWFRNLMVFCALCVMGYCVYKKRFNEFNFVQYRRKMFGNGIGGGFGYGRVNSSGVGESEMYSNLNSSTTFEPPTLPPTPQMMT